MMMLPWLGLGLCLGKATSLGLGKAANHGLGNGSLGLGLGGAFCSMLCLGTHLVGGVTRV